MDTNEKTGFEQLIFNIIKSCPEDKMNECAYFISNSDAAREICFESENFARCAVSNAFEKINTALEIGAGFGTFTGVLADMSTRLVCCEKDPCALEIIRMRRAKHKNISYISELSGDAFNSQYDLIWANAADSSLSDYGISVLTELIKAVYSRLSPKGRGLLIIPNSFGDYPCEKKYSRSEIEAAVGKSGAKCRFYYPYPNIRSMLFLFTDKRLPAVSELFYDSSVCKNGTYEELLDNYRFADVFLCEIFSEACDENIYSKMSVMRKKCFSIRTDITEKNTVIKSAADMTDKTARKHINVMKTSEKRLSELFGNGLMQINKITAAADGRAEFEFIDGVCLFDIISQKLRESPAQAKEIIFRFAQLLRGKAYDKFAFTEQFYSIFGRSLKSDGFYCMPYTDIDLCFDNIIIRNGRWVITDYEFCCGFPVPVDFVIFRAVFYLLRKSENLPCPEETEYELFERLGILSFKNAFLKMEYNFQKSITGDIHYQSETLKKCSERERDIPSAQAALKKFTAKQQRNIP